jgi:hypothetical protein
VREKAYFKYLSHLEEYLRPLLTQLGGGWEIHRIVEDHAAWYFLEWNNGEILHINITDSITDCITIRFSRFASSSGFIDHPHTGAKCKLHAYIEMCIREAWLKSGIVTRPVYLNGQEVEL